MVPGAVWCPKDKSREIAVRLREIKQNHGLSSLFEVKWAIPRFHWLTEVLLTFM